MIIRIRLETEKRSDVFDMNSEEFELACKEAVANRDAVASVGYVTMIDEETGRH